MAQKAAAVLTDINSASGDGEEQLSVRRVEQIAVSHVYPICSRASELATLNSTVALRIRWQWCGVAWCGHRS